MHSLKASFPDHPFAPSNSRNSRPRFNPTFLSQLPTIRPLKAATSVAKSSEFPRRMCDKRAIFGHRVGVARVVCEGGKEDDNGDRFYMRRCVEIAGKAVGCTSPNPMVGCVIVKDGKVVGEGFHPKAGQPHAEVFALRDAGDLAENATAYVSLEPCNHYGRTPPCSEALIKAKIKRVVIGMVDPNPIVDSKGIDRLRAAGIEVTVGVEEELCKKLNEPFIHQMLTGKPFVSLRYSISINGHVSCMLGEGATEAGGYYSKLLQEYDAVLLSSSSLTEKLLLPTSQEPGAKQPLSIIIARGPDFAVDPSLAVDPSTKVIIFTDNEGIGSKAVLNGIETVVLKHMSLEAILDYCKPQGLLSLLIDLRGNLSDFQELLKEDVEWNFLRKIMVEVLPLCSDDSTGQIPLGISKRIKLKYLKPKIFNESVILEGYL